MWAGLSTGLPILGRLASGELKVELHGEKRRGSFVLVHMGRISGTPRERAAGC
jgi:hypothetical protein